MSNQPKISRPLCSTSTDPLGVAHPLLRTSGLKQCPKPVTVPFVINTWGDSEKDCEAFAAAKPVQQHRQKLCHSQTIHHGLNAQPGK